MMSEEVCMKRCPLCEFIYDDDQNLCDMDGIELVGDRGTDLPPAAEEAQAPVTQVVSPRRRFSFPLLMLGLLGAALLSAYYTSTDMAASANTGAPPAQADGRPEPEPVQMPVVPPDATPTPSPAGTPSSDPRVNGTAPPQARQAPAPPRSRTNGTRERKSEPVSGDNKKESKLGSFLSKTGRILKKPFKL